MERFFNPQLLSQEKVTRIWTFALLLQLLAALFSQGFFHWDEHFQILEFLNFKWGGTSSKDLPWEFHHKMRSFFQPAQYFFISKIVNFFGVNNPFILEKVFRVFSVFVGIGSQFYLWKVLNLRWKKVEISYLSALIFTLFWFFPFINTRISGEAFGASLFCLGLGLLLHPERKKLYLAGLVFGLSFLCRFQLGISIFFLGIWSLVFKELNLKEFFKVIGGIILAFAFGAGIDFWGYGSWSFPPIEYIFQNLVKGKANNYGVSPIYAYFSYILKKGIWPFGALIIVSTLWFWGRFWKSPLTWVTLPFFIVHSLISHKELRFLFPLVPFIPFMMASFFFNLRDKSKIWHFLKKRPIKLFGKILLGVNLVLLIAVLLRPVHQSVPFFKHYYSQNQNLPFYVIGDFNPFFMAQLKVSYYGPTPKETQSFPETKDLDQFTSGKKGLIHWVFVTRGKPFLEMKERKNCSTNYQSYPEWALKINIGNWQKRSKIWGLFLCSNS